MSNDEIISKEEVVRLIQEHENFDIASYVEATEDGQQILEVQRLLRDGLAKPWKSVGTTAKSNGRSITKYTFYNGQSVSFDENKVVIKLKTKKNKR